MLADKNAREAVYMKRMRLGFIFLVAAAVSFMGCLMEELDEGDTFVPVKSITGVPRTGFVGTELILSGKGAPSSATNKTITKWTIKDADTTGITAIVNGNKVTAMAAGTLTVTATIANGKTETTSYKQDFDIEFSNKFVPVTDITGVPKEGIINIPLTLTGTVTPSNATNKDIVWELTDAGATGATLTGNKITATTTGTLKVKATIANGTAQGTAFTSLNEFPIEFKLVPVSSISDVPTTGKVKTQLTLTGTVMPPNASYKDIVWAVTDAGTTGATLTGNKVTATAAGTLKVTATIAKGLTKTSYKQDFDIIFNIEPVTNITGVPTTGTVGTALTLTGTVAPANATNKIITWSVKDDPNSTSTGTVSGNKVTATVAGTLTVTATIKDGTAQGSDYTQDFPITFSNPFVQFVPVAKVINIPTAWTVGTAPELILNGEVLPKNANNQDIKYSIKNAGSTGVTDIKSDKKVFATAPGTLVVTATIEKGKIDNGVIKDYTQDFPIEIIVPVSSITDVPTETEDTELTLTGTVMPSNASYKDIVWAVTDAGTTGATITGNTVTVKAPGILKVTATIEKGKIKWTDVNTAKQNGVITDYTEDFEIEFVQGPSEPSEPSGSKSKPR